jgi:membrane fusion protein (multidrug efflux system)
MPRSSIPECTACFIRVLAAAGLIPLLAAGCGKQEAAPQGGPPPAEVKVAPARSETVPVLREYVGNVSAYRSVQVRARVEGILEKRHFTEGVKVTAGQLLYSIDPATYEATLRDAQASLAQAEANLSNAKVREARYAPLAKENAISKQDYDDAVTQMKQAESSVQAARATLDRAKLNLGYTKIYATEAGRIGTSQVPEGALVGKGEPTLLATIEKLDPIYVNFTMPDRDALILQRAFRSGEVKEQQGESVRFVLPDGSHYQQAGRIDFSDAQVNRDTGTINLRAVLPNRGEPRLLPGMFVRVEMTAGQRPGTILVPQQAVMKVPTGHVAFVVTTENKVERRDLVVGEWIGDDWIVEKGLAAGDRVVVEGVQKVQPGATVRPAPYGAAPAAAPSPALKPAAATEQPAKPAGEAK